MNPKAQAIFFLAALVASIVSAAIAWFDERSDALRRALAFFALALAFYLFVFVWNSFEAAW